MRIPQGLTALERRTALVIAMSAIALSIAAALPPHDSKDVWSYVMYGRTISEHDANPYLHAPNEYPQDELLSRVAPGWAHVETVYGPAFTIISAAGSFVAGDSPVTNRLWHQGIAALSVFVLACFLRTRAAFLLLCLNPAVWFMVNGGHNDLLMGVLVATGIASKRTYLGAALIACAILVKATAIIPAVAAYLVWRQWKPALLTAVIVVLAYVPFGGWQAIQPLLNGSGTTSRASIWSLPQHVLGSGEWLTAVWVTCIGGALYLARNNKDAPTVVTLVAIFTAPYVLPWYCGWVLPLAAFASRQLQIVAALQSLLLLAAYATPPGSEIDNPFAPVALPLGLVTWLLLRRRTQRRQQQHSQASSATADLP